MGKKNTKVAHHLFTVMLVVLFFLVSFKYKQNNVPSIRPFYNLGLIIIGFLFAFNYIKSFYKETIILSLIRQPQFICLFFILFYFFISSLFGQGREFKDFLYFSYWLLIFPLLLSYYINTKFNADELLFLLSKAILLFAILASIIAILVFLGIVEFEYGSIILKQNNWTANRIHGFMGEPTAFGGLIGLSIIALSYLKNYRNSYYDWMIYSFLFISLFWSGSRNAIFSLFLVFFTGLVVGNKANLTKMLKVILLIAAFVVVALIFNIEWVIQAINRYTFALKNDLGSEIDSSRLYIWLTSLSMYSHGGWFELIFGSGAGAIREDYRAAFNASIEILYDYGMVGFFLYQILFIGSIYMGVIRYIMTKNHIYKYGVMFLVYGYSFSLFMSFFPSYFFNFPAFAFIFGIVLTAIPIHKAFPK